MIAGIAIFAILVAAWLAARWFGHGRPCPVTIAGLFDNRIADRMSGVSTLMVRARLAPGMCVLDAGCGPGRLTIPLARRVGPMGEVVGLDVQQGMLDRVERRVRREGLTNVRTVRASLGTNAPALRAFAGRFDRVLMVTVLGEIPDAVAALGELATTLKPDGILSVTEMILDPDYLTRHRVTELARRAGYGIDSTFGNRLAFTINLRRSQTPS